jgi:hypothetical protein
MTTPTVFSVNLTKAICFDQNIPLYTISNVYTCIDYMPKINGRTYPSLGDRLQTVLLLMNNMIEKVPFYYLVDFIIVSSAIQNCFWQQI